MCVCALVWVSMSRRPTFTWKSDYHRTMSSCNSSKWKEWYCRRGCRCIISSPRSSKYNCYRYCTSQLQCHNNLSIRVKASAHPCGNSATQELVFKKKVKNANESSSYNMTQGCSCDTVALLLTQLTICMQFSNDETYWCPWTSKLNFDLGTRISISRYSAQCDFKFQI